MNNLEDQLTSAAEEARRQVAHVQTRPATAVRTRKYRHRAFAGAAVAVGVFGLLGATALVTNTDLTTDMAAAPGSTAAVTTTVPPVVAVPPEEAPPEDATLRFLPGDITDLVVGIDASSELAGFEAANLIDGDPTTVWKDDSLRGSGATITLRFDQPVAISDLVIQGVGIEDRFVLNYKVQGYEISVDDKPGVIPGRLTNSMEPQHIGIDSAETTALTLSVTTTFPAEPLGDHPPFNELAIGEIRVIGAAVDDSPAPTQTTTTIVREAGTAGTAPKDAVVGTDDLVIQSVSVEAFPKVGVCVNPDDGIVSPSHSAVVSDGPAYDTPRDALVAFLAETDGVFPSPPTTLSESAYVEMIKPDGSIGYGYMGGFEAEGFDYSTDFDPEEWGLATLITTTETTEGWTVDSWGASGC